MLQESVPPGHLLPTCNQASIPFPSRKPDFISGGLNMKRPHLDCGHHKHRGNGVGLKREDKIKLCKLNQRISILFLILNNSHLRTE